MQKITIAGTIGNTKPVNQVGDQSVLNFSVSVSNGKNADGSWRDSTWYDCALWGKRADAVSSFIQKGGKITVDGRPTVRVHEGKAYLGVTVNDFTLQGGGEQQPEPQRQPDSTETDEIPF